MPLLDQTREAALVKLATARYAAELTEAERKVLHDSASSETLPDPGEDAPHPEVRADFLRWLATDPNAALHIDPKGLRVYGVVLKDDLDLQACSVAAALNFHGCVMQSGMNLRHAETRDITFKDCSIEGWVQADGIDVRGSFTLYGSRTYGEIGMIGAQVKGDLHFHNSKLEAKEGDALSADGIRVGGNVQFHNGFTSNGTVKLRGASISGNLDLSGAKLGVKEGDSLSADGVDVGGSVNLIEGFSTNGTIRLRGARIRGVLNCSGATLEVREGDAISVHRAKIDGGIYLNEGFTSSGEISLRYSQIGAGLFCTGAKLEAKDGNALSADGAEISGSVHLDGGFTSKGAIVLHSTQIRGVLLCAGAKLKAKRDALSADGAKIGGGVFLDDGFESEGTIRLLGTEIAGSIDCSGAKLKAKGNALCVDGARIGGNVFLNKDLESEGRVRLVGAEIGGDIVLREAKVAEVVCHNIVVKGDLIWQSIEKSEKTSLNLAGARVKNLRDDRMSWPEGEMLNLDGLVYEELTIHAPLSAETLKADRYAPELALVARERIEWIMLQPVDRRIEPQPWMQLRDLLERKGDRKGAKHVIFKFRCLQAETQGVLRRAGIIAFALLEEAPERIRYTIVATLLLGWLIFGVAGSNGALAPTVPVAYQAFITGKPMPAAYPALNPFVYTLENAVPLVKLGQDEKWAPDKRYPGTSWYTNYWFLMWSRWLLILSGWFQATVLAAALADRFKK